ncbi:MAG TPA: CDP-alcohol phosphatidyltransferase family protein [Thermoplasmata archaeon]|jgi:CDP-diacylglycerol--serine O-phosphatidyltransferase
MAALSKVSSADLFTLANGVLGFVAITFILEDRFFGAIGLLFLSMVMDGLDGYIARRYGSKHAFGQVLDSISDSISFAFAPALLIYAEFVGHSGDIIVDAAAILSAIAVLSTGLFRLARFSAGGYQLDYFVGMPAPAAALVIILVCLLFGTHGVSDSEDYYFMIAEEPWIVIGIGFLVSFLMASEIPYPKVRGWLSYVSGFAILLAVLPYFAGPVLVDDQDLYRAFSRTATSVALALTLIYVFGGPVYERLKRGKGG